MAMPHCGRTRHRAWWHSFRLAHERMQGLAFVNPALDVEAVAFAPWQGHWLGVLVTPWFMNLILAPRDATAWTSLKPGEKRSYLFPAGAFDFIGAHDDVAGEYQMCSLFSPLLHFDDQETARLVAGWRARRCSTPPTPRRRTCRSATFRPHACPSSTEPGPIAQLEAQLTAPQSKRDFLRVRWTGDDRGDRG